jgi:hypothetical protein
VFLWLTQARLLTAATPPWIEAVARNFVRRYWRSRKVRHERESRAARDFAAQLKSKDGTAGAEVRLSLDQMEKKLPQVEARLLHMVRCGCSFAEAVRAVGIQRGSSSFFQHRLIASLAKGLKAPKARLPRRRVPLNLQAEGEASDRGEPGLQASL